MDANKQDPDSVTEWMNNLRDGDERAARNLWTHFVDRLQRAPRQKIRPKTRTVYDEEDAALSAFDSLCRGIATGRYPDLEDRGSLWNLLLTIASRKVSHQHRRDTQKLRDSRRTVGLTLQQDAGDGSGLELSLQSAEPTPQLLAEFQDTWDLLFERLTDETLRTVSLMKIEGFTDVEVAEKLGLTDRTIRRKVERIRRIWRETMPEVFDDDSGDHS